MKVEIKSGIEDVVNASNEGKDLNLYYSISQKAVLFRKDDAPVEGVQWIATVRKPITAEEVQQLVNLVLTAIAIGRALNVPADTSKYTGVAIYGMYEEMGFTVDNYEDFLMSCYLWKTYTNRHLQKGEEQEATFYLSDDGNSRVADYAERPERWCDRFMVRTRKVFLAVNLPVKFAAESEYTIATAVLLYYKSYKKALDYQRQFYAEQ